MGLNKEVTILGAKRVDFDNAGDKVQGTQIHYYDNESQNENDIKGCIPAKAWLSLNEFEKFINRQYPAKAIVSYDIDIAKSKLIPKSFEFVK